MDRKRHQLRPAWLLPMAAALALSLSGLAVLAQQPRGGAAPAKAPARQLPRSDSKSTFVHNILLRDDKGEDLKATSDQPYSPYKTCGKCHDSDAVAHGWHFNAFEAKPKAKAPGTQPAGPAVFAPAHAPGRPGEPWIYVDRATATQLPITPRAWPGTFRPSDVGLSPRSFFERYARNLPGGLNNKTGTPGGESDRNPRWSFTGKLDIDCLVCHTNERAYNTNEWQRQVERENYRWAPSAAIGLGLVEGVAKRLPDDFDPDAAATQPAQGGYPSIALRKDRFDGKDYVLFDMVRRPPNNQCYLCHTSRPVGQGAPESWQMDTDVHLKAGLKCSDCHRHGIDHKIARGYETEAQETGNPAVATLSCRGCHYSGRIGAPTPLHKGLPPIHLDRLSCTACHSGPKPQQKPGLVQTSLTHGLGQDTPERTDKSRPFVQMPVFLRGHDGKTAPHKVVWPAYFADAKTFKPVPMDQVTKAVQTAAGRNGILSDPTPEQITAVLKALDPKGGCVYVMGGKVYQLGTDGKLSEASDPRAAPYAWPMAHDVRPKQESLGVRGCTDCHSLEAPLYFGELSPLSPTGVELKPAKSMHELQGLDGNVAKAWALSFIFRPYFKIFAFACVAVVAAVVAAYGATGLVRRLTPRR